MPVDPLKLYGILTKKRVDFFSGVPDSLLKEFISCLNEKAPENRHIVAANEGNAIGLAAGYYLATGRVPLVYMQNSGLGNAVNPFLSLCDRKVYSIPVLLLIGWRGEPGVPDEPQHNKQGKVQFKLLEAMGIPYLVLSRDEVKAGRQIDKAAKRAAADKAPFAVIIREKTFSPYPGPEIHGDGFLLSREEALEMLLKHLPGGSPVVSTTGKASREIFEIRKKNKQPHSGDFLTIGSMGHCSSIALGIALARPARKVFCIDGDGALIMHMGSLATAGKAKPENFCHILINNRVHESTGCQETAASPAVSFPEIARSCGYKHVYSVRTCNQLAKVLQKAITGKGPDFLEIKVRPGSRKDLGRPTDKPKDNKESFMRFLRQAR